MGNVLKYDFLGGILKESSNVLYLFFAVCRSVVLSSFQILHLELRYVVPGRVFTI